MDTVVFDGVEYTKASVAAKEFRYTSDYLGQLCRAKKIDARLVGRTWFVNTASINTHKKSKYSKKVTISTSTDDADIAKEIKINQTTVNPVVKSKTARSVKQSSDLKNKERKLHVFYELDDEVLIPHLTRKDTPPPKKIAVVPAGAKPVRIKGKENPTTFHTSELPDIALSGKLAVTSYTKADIEAKPETDDKKNVPEDVDNMAENKASSDTQPKVQTAKVVKKPSTTSTKFRSPKPTKKLVVAMKAKPRPAVKKTVKQPPAGKLATPTKVNQVKVQSLEPPTPLLIRISPLIATVVALICVTILLSASSEVIVLGSAFESKIVLQLANLHEAFLR